jgi:hypothetical protein
MVLNNFQSINSVRGVIQNMNSDDIKNWDISKSPYTKNEARVRFHLGLGMLSFSIIGLFLMMVFVFNN